MFVWGWYERRRLRLLAMGASGDVLDVGFAEMPNTFFPSTAKVTGIDLFGVEPVPGYDRQIVGDLAGSPEIEGLEYDYVIAGEVLEHVSEPYEFLAAALERTRPGGELRLSTPNPLGFPAVLFEYGRSRRRFFSEDHRFYFTPRWVEKMLHDVGFEMVKTRAVGLWLPGVPLGWCPVTLSYQVLYSARRPV